MTKLDPYSTGSVDDDFTLPQAYHDFNLPRYDPRQTYDWNYDHAPSPVSVDVVDVPGEWRFCGLKVDSPLGVPAGPLLNSRWVLYYASLGFDVLTYKTVRSSARPCYALPNLLPVRCQSLSGTETRLLENESMEGSWAVSFGMPSKAPHLWRADVEWTRSKLPANKILCVSVVGSIEPGWTIDDLARDYATCAHWAVDSGADAVELNFSCPNVSTCDGQLYQDYIGAREVAQQVREAIGRAPLIIKVGHVPRDEDVERLVAAVADLVDGLAMTNSIASTVVSRSGELLFDGQKRGICGLATLESSIAQVQRFAHVLSRQNLSSPALIGVGGSSAAEHLRRYLASGASAVQIATAAMIQPDIALRIRTELHRALE